MLPYTEKHTLGRVIDLDVTQKHSIFKGFHVTSILLSQHVLSAETYPKFMISPPSVHSMCVPSAAPAVSKALVYTKAFWYN